MHGHTVMRLPHDLKRLVTLPAIVNAGILHLNSYKGTSEEFSLH